MICKSSTLNAGVLFSLVFFVIFYCSIVKEVESGVNVTNKIGIEEMKSSCIPFKQIEDLDID